MKRSAVLLLLALLLSLELVAMEAETVKMAVWRRGESIGGEEFIAANESIVDYLATLNRPTGTWEVIKYSCQAKYRTILPTVRTTGSSNYDYVTVRMVYALSDCVEVEKR
ncbi:MAG: hypothetical protein R3B54_10995 [Bdellovibrionota bacterium]